MQRTAHKCLISIVEVFVALLVVISLAGCSSRNALNVGSLSMLPGHKRMRPIANIICIWKPAEGRDMKNRPARGLAGKILFFPAGNQQPAKLAGEGMVVVYVFDDQGAVSERQKPIHKFEFPIDVWNLHYRDSQLGPSYDVFIPYTRSVVHQVKMTAYVRLVPTTGSPASSSMDTVTLPGPKRKFDNETLVHHVSRKTAGPKTRVSTLNNESMRNEQLPARGNLRGAIASRRDPRGEVDPRQNVRQASAFQDSQPAPLPRGELLRRFVEAQNRKKLQRAAAVDGVIKRRVERHEPAPAERRWNLNDDADDQPREMPPRFRLGPTTTQTRVRRDPSLPTPFRGRGQFTPPAGSDVRHTPAGDRSADGHPLLAGGDNRSQRRAAPRRLAEEHRADSRPAREVSESSYVTEIDEPTPRRRSEVFNRESAKQLFDGQ